METAVIWDAIAPINVMLTEIVQQAYVNKYVASLVDLCSHINAWWQPWRAKIFHGQKLSKSHHNDFIMVTIAFQITGVSIVCSIVCSGADQLKYHFTRLCEGNPPVAYGFSSQRASNAGNVFIWWHHLVISSGMCLLIDQYHLMPGHLLAGITQLYAYVFLVALGGFILPEAASRMHKLYIIYNIFGWNYFSPI